MSENYNFYSFWQTEEDETKSRLKCMEFDDETMGKFADEEGSELGHKYQIVLVRDHDEDEEKFADLDIFEAILAHPITYIKQLMSWGWYGVVIRKSEKSGKYVDIAVAEIQELL